MLDAELAELYHVETGALVRAMKRNLDRFPEDFAFQLTKEEFDNLRSQTGISSWGPRPQDKNHRDKRRRALEKDQQNRSLQGASRFS